MGQKLKIKNTYFHLGTGLFLHPSGKIVDEVPKDGKIVPMPVVINFPDLIKDELKGQDVNKHIQSLLKSGYLTDLFGISPKTLEILGASINLLFSLSTVIGAIGAYAEVLKLLVGSSAGQKDTLAQVHQLVNEVHDLVKDAGKGVAVDKVIIESKAIRSGEIALRHFLSDNSPGVAAFTNLLERYNELFAATETLLNPDFETNTKEASDFSAFPWYADRSWLEARSGSPLPESADINKMTQAKRQWDYTPYIGAITDAVSLLMLYYKTMDPAFRTTGIFQVELMKIAVDLEAFGQEMIKHILWTRDWNLGDYYFRPMAHGWPVGAVDVCSGLSVLDSGWMEGVQVAPPATGAIGNHVNPAGVLMEPPIVLNVSESIKKARGVREKDWVYVMYASGAPKILQLAETLKQMATIPDVSETVITSIRKSARRKQVKSEPRLTPQMPRCEALEFTASVYEVKRSVQVDGSLQAPKRHPEQPNYWPIPYKFFIETYPGSVAAGQPLSRVEITPGSQSVSLQAQIFDWEVEDTKIQFEITPVIQDQLEHLRQDKFFVLSNLRPDLQVTRYPWNQPLNRTPELFDDLINDPDLAGTPRYGKIGTVRIDYQFRRGDGKFSAIFRNGPGRENFAGVYLLVEEQTRIVDSSGQKKLGPVIKTRIDISMIGREHHLPKKYFEYIQMCEARTRAIISQIEFEHRLMERPIPRWDPAIFENVQDWVRNVLSDQPDVLKGDLLAEVQVLAGRTPGESY